MMLAGIEVGPGPSPVTFDREVVRYLAAVALPAEWPWALSSARLSGCEAFSENLVNNQLTDL